MDNFIKTSLSQFHALNGLTLDAIERRWRKREQLRVRSNSSTFKALRVEKCREKLLRTLIKMERSHLVCHYYRKNKQSHRNETLWKLIENIKDDDEEEQVCEDKELKEAKHSLSKKMSVPDINITTVQNRRKGWEILKEKFADGTLTKYVKSILGTWDNLNWDDIQEERAVKWVYSNKTCKWTSNTIILVKIHDEAFAQGAMRKCYRMKKYEPKYLFAKTPSSKNWNTASPYVAKVYYGEHESEANSNDGQVYKDDVVLQKECSKYADKFNELRPPKRIEFVREIFMFVNFHFLSVAITNFPEIISFFISGTCLVNSND